MRPADKLQLKAATILPLVGLARSKQDPINRGRGAQYLYRPPPRGPGPAGDIIGMKAYDMDGVKCALHPVDNVGQITVALQAATARYLLAATGTCTPPC